MFSSSEEMLLDSDNTKFSLVEKLTGKMVCRAPSNLALIKYWGKKGHQLPANPSLSLTLRESVTNLQAEFCFDVNSKRPPTELWNFQFQGEGGDKFSSKIFGHLEVMARFYPFLLKTRLDISSSNTFPHSAGIASSASSFFALALVVEALASTMRGQRNEEFLQDQKFLQRTSFLSRFGSGSACRSAFPIAAVWGETSLFSNTSDEWAVPVGMKFSFLKKIQDMIMVVDQGPKKISSRQGHELMSKHPYASFRYRNAFEKLIQICNRLKECESSINSASAFHTVGEIIEGEALELHSLMMTSNPPVILMAPTTLSIISALWEWRQKTNVPLYFTLDAGPNLHLLYPRDVEKEVQEFKQFLSLRNILPAMIINDGAGPGPELLKFESDQSFIK